ncbi:hypothetical protein UFOVP1_45 [uncultured Caudovirales phage]|uniref:Uncharacterized protein n=1 Tax=uncultured Caudovirales phage TaxID=2100421 RepID=A0A6J5KHF3_9CAUD|nr:hypothetical protein UFOVP1_45 [uncultured Caudovirales phage]
MDNVFSNITPDNIQPAPAQTAAPPSGQPAQTATVQQATPPTQQSNPFADIKPDETPAPQPPDTSKTSAPMTYLDSMNKQFDDIGTGVQQKIAQGVKYLGDATNSPSISSAGQTYLDKIDAYRQNGSTINGAPSAPQLAQEQLDNPKAALAGTLTGIFGRTFAFGGGAAVALPSTALGMIGANAVAGGLQAGADYTQPGQSALYNAGQGALVSGLGAGAIMGLGAIAGNVIPSIASANAAAGLAGKIQGMGGTDAMQAGAAPFNSIGMTNPGLADVMGPQAGGIEAGALANYASGAAGAAKLNANEAILRPQVGDMLNSLTPTSDQLGTKFASAIPPDADPVQAATAVKNAMYNSFKGQTVPQQGLDNLLQDPISGPIIQKELNNMNNSTSTMVGNLPNNDLGKLDVLKQNLQSQIYNGKGLTAMNTEKNLSPDDASAIKYTLGQLIPTLDQTTPDYAQARGIAEQLTLRNQLVNKIATIDPKGGITPTTDLSQVANTYPLDKVYSNLFGTADKQQSFYDSLASANIDPTNAQNIISVLNSTRNSPLKQFVGASTKSGDYMAAANAGSDNSILGKVSSLLSGQYNHQLADLLTNGNWQQKVAPILNATDSNDGKIGLLANILDNSKTAQILNGAAGIGSQIGGQEQAQGVPVLRGAGIGAKVLFDNRNRIPIVGHFLGGR